jgi:lipopolysaccharide export system protein LptA
MVCKKRAFMTLKPSSLLRHLLLPALALCLGLGAAQAERADRDKPINIDYDRGGVDLVKQRTEFSGNVVLTKGSMLLRAEHMDVRETADGYKQAYATGASGKPVSFRQARDVPGESIEGWADQVEYDTRSDTMRFIGNAVLRRLRGTAVADEVVGAVIHYDNRSEVFSIEGGQASPHPAGRGRVVMMPRAASAPASPASDAGVTLQPSLTLRPRQPS